MVREKEGLGFRNHVGMSTLTDFYRIPSFHR